MLGALEALEYRARILPLELSDELVRLVFAGLVGRVRTHNNDRQNGHDRCLAENCLLWSAVRKDIPASCVSVRLHVLWNVLRTQ